MEAKVCLVLLLVVACRAYRNGPPLEACKHMFPEGHGYDAQTTGDPFSLNVDKTAYSPGEEITVTYETNGNLFAEGMFVQARLADCSSDIAVGTFQLPQGEDFLQVFPCNGNQASAVRHYSHLKIYNRTMTWTAPNPAVGHIYFRATMARNQSLFWTNVFSPFVRDTSSSAALPSRYCTVQTTAGASPLLRGGSLLLGALTALVALFV